MNTLHPSQPTPAHPSEDDLIAYQLHESPNPVAVAHHLELCPHCAEVSASIAETLRVFSAEPVPTANLDHNWNRLRSNLPALTTTPRRSFRPFLWPAVGLALAATALLVFFAARPRHSQLPPQNNIALKPNGPLSVTPADPEIAAQLDSAERLLTEVNHTNGPLDDNTRAQAHQLLVKNALYIRTANERGDLGTASVLEDLGRVLTNIDHEPEKKPDGWHLRLEMNTDGLLLDIRILQQNDAHQ